MWLMVEAEIRGCSGRPTTARIDPQKQEEARNDLTQPQWVQGPTDT